MSVLPSERCEPMDETAIRKYAHLMRELDLTALEVNEREQTIRLERAPAGIPAAGPLPSAAAAPAAATIPAADEYIVRSPIVGTFYAAPAEDAEPFVKAGDRVQKGTVLCIIEAMKLMNEIPAEEAGVILDVCAENGQIVEYGTELFRIGRE